MTLNRLLIQLKPWASLSEYTSFYPPQRELQPIEVVIAREIAMVQGAILPTWLRNRTDVVIEPVDALAMSNQLKTLIWMKTNTPHLAKPTIHTAEIASLKGHASVVEWLYQNHDMERKDSVVKLAILSGNVELVKWLYKHDFPFDGAADWARDRYTRELVSTLLREQNRRSCSCFIL